MGRENDSADLTWQNFTGSAEKQNIPKSRCAKPVASYSRSLEAVPAAGGASTTS